MNAGLSPDTPVEHFLRVTADQKSALKKLGIITMRDLLYHFPTRYSDVGHIKMIRDVAAGDTVSVYGRVTGLGLKKGFRSRIPMAEATLTDETGSLGIIWFHQAYIAKMIPEGMQAKFTGKISEKKGSGKKAGTLYMSNPEYEKVEKLPIIGDSLFAKGEIGADDTQFLAYPVYPESRGISSKWFYHTIQKLFSAGILEQMEDPIPAKILEKYNLPKLQTALVWAHTPKRAADAEVARKRFAFEEVFFIQLEKQKERLAVEKSPTFVIKKNDEEMRKFTSRFPFKMTTAQEKAIVQISEDFSRGFAMSRLLEGDVGSGKTAVAATTAYATVTTRPENQSAGALQVAYMAPTEILATQHFESFIKYFTHLRVPVALITSSGCRKFPSKIDPSGWTDISKTQLTKWVANGDIPIVIGTHSLIQKSVSFKHLAYVIIDEQHRFGTRERQKLARKNEAKIPHLLSMTATPIPRTLALTIYGDLDLTLLDEMPHGRKPIITEIVPPTKRDAMYEKVRAELSRGKQVYVICPRIDEPDPTKEMALNTKSVKAEAKRLQEKIFPEYDVAIIHSKMKPDGKEETMRAFSENEAQILVATSLVEVGVNVPNATVIIIEGAERFGLSQLHQLRGRVIRSNDQAYCYVFSESKSQKSLDRLHALTTAKNGFELAEYDLAQRGAGELSGRKQWGVSDIAMEALKNIKMVEAARTEARAIVEGDPDLTKHPLLAKKLRENEAKIHFE